MLMYHEGPHLGSRFQYSNATKKEIVCKEYETFEKRRKEYEAALADKQDLQELETDIKSLQGKKE